MTCVCVLKVLTYSLVFACLEVCVYEIEVLTCLIWCGSPTEVVLTASYLLKRPVENRSRGEGVGGRERGRRGWQTVRGPKTGEKEDRMEDEDEKRGG